MVNYMDVRKNREHVYDVHALNGLQKQTGLG